MPYVGFLDMLGTRAKASLSEKDYTSAVDSFNDKLSAYSDTYNAKVYAYSDNAYVQFDNLDNMIDFFRELRNTLMLNHYYFCAAVEKGTLSSHSEPFVSKDNYHSMKFTSDAAVKVYRLQLQYTGIGIFLSNTIAESLKGIPNGAFCKSVCLKNELMDGEFTLMPVYDISYQGVSASKLEFLLSDYLITAATDPRAGRYYISAAISMIKSIDLFRFQDDNTLHQMIQILSFQTIPKCFQNISHNKTYTLYFLFSLIERVLSTVNSDDYSDINTWEICEIIIKKFGIEHGELIAKLSKIPSAILSEKNKQMFLSILFNIT